MKNNFFQIAAKFTAILFWFGIFLPVGEAQAKADVQLTSAEASQFTEPSSGLKKWQIFAVFDHNFDLAKDKTVLANQSNYKILNISSNLTLTPEQAVPVQIQGSTIASVRLILNANDSLDIASLYHLYALNLTFGGEAVENPQKLQAPVKIRVIKKPATQPPATGGGQSNAELNEAPKPSWKFDKSKDRDDSDIYGSYQLTATRGAATTGTGDLKVAIPFTKNFWKRRSTFSPVVDIKVSSDAEADPDSLKFALEWFLPLYVSDNQNAKFPYTAVDWINSAKIEAPKNFDNINALWESRFLFPSSKFPWENKNFKMFLDPFAGSEIGKNLKSPLKAAQGKAITRLYFGANLTLQIPVKDLSLLKGFEMNTSYIRRLPLKRELNFDKDASGNLILATFGKGPKDYVDSKLIMKLNDYFGPFIGFEWGRLPPNYSLVDHKWTFGLLFKTKIKTR